MLNLLPEAVISEIPQQVHQKLSDSNHYIMLFNSFKITDNFTFSGG